MPVHSASNTRVTALCAGIHVLASSSTIKAWMAGTSPDNAGHDGLEAAVRLARSGPGKRRGTLFHERPAALGIIVAGKALLDQVCATREIALAFVLDRFADDELRSLHRERGIGGDRSGVLLYRLF